MRRVLTYCLPTLILEAEFIILGWEQRLYMNFNDLVWTGRPTALPLVLQCGFASRVSNTGLRTCAHS